MTRPPLVAIRMVRPDLDGLPIASPPAGFAFRFYRSGDDETWTRIHHEAERFHEIGADLFRQEFGHAEDELARRQLFVCDPAGREVGTATAWFDPSRGEPWGRIHWVAVSESHQGRGLGRALVSAVCQRFKELGHTRAYLMTETVRLPAIHLYESFGFRLAPAPAEGASRP